MFSTYQTAIPQDICSKVSINNWQAYVSLFIYGRSVGEKRSVDKWLWFLTIVTTLPLALPNTFLPLYSRSYPYQLAETTSHTSILIQVDNPNAILFESATSSLIAYYNIFPVGLEVLSTCSTLHVIYLYRVIRIRTATAAATALFVFACPLLLLFFFFIDTHYYYRSRVSS